jgi:hypothetical protein
MHISVSDYTLRNGFHQAKDRFTFSGSGFIMAADRTICFLSSSPEQEQQE